MNQRRQVGLVAAAATLMAATPLATVYAQWNWLFECALAVGAVAGAALLARLGRAPVWAQGLAMMGALAIALTWLFPSGHEFAGLIPGPGTVRHAGDLLDAAGADMRQYGLPAPTTPGLMFLTVLGIGAVAILVDLFAVGLRRPALAGLPMLAIYSVPVAIHTDDIALTPFVIGTAGYLWLLVTDHVNRVRRFGRRFTGDGRDVDLWEPSPLASAGRRLATVGMLVAVAVPLAVPVMGTGLLDGLSTDGNGPGTGRGIGSGRGGAVNLFAELSGQLNQDATHDMVRVDTNDPDPYYLRFGIADEVTASGFRARAIGSGKAVTAGLPDPTLNLPGVTQNRYHASVDIVDLTMPMLPVYVQPTRMDKVDSSWLYDPASGLVYSRRSTSKGKKYAFDYVHTQFSPQALRTAPPVPDGDPVLRPNTAVPGVPEVQKLVADLTRGKTTPYDKVMAIYDYFATSGFSYSLSTKSGTSGSDIVDFLNNKQGYCEQYAAAMTWLVRAAGIPARVAFGFTRGGNRDGTKYTLTNRNLHAWTEVYFEGFGWVPFDATPPAYIAGSVSPAWAPDPRSPQSTTPGGQVGGGSGSPGARDPLDPDRKIAGAEGGSSVGAATPVRRAPSWPWWTLGGVLAVLVLLATPAVTRIAQRRRRTNARPAPPKSRAVAVGDRPARSGIVVTGESSVDAARLDAHQAWDELLDTLVDFGIDVDRAETPRVTAERVVQEQSLRAEVADAARLLGRAEERARYAREPLVTDQLSRSVRAVRAAIAARVSTRTRLRAAVLPRSVLYRWSGWAAATVGNTVAAVGRWRERAARAVSPRRLLAWRTGR
ncbi:MAG TPA: DUF3488 and transglutaminase-like domain-containing protein [Micromonosporaceae bacterium]